MSIYTKPLSQLGSSDLQELLTEKAVENVRLEFKSAVPNKDETLKKLSSFANTFGGYMVIGATESNGRIEDLPGVDQVAGYKQTVVQWSFGGAYPPLMVEVSDPIPVPAGNGKVCYVIYVGESDVAPHFLNGRKGVYVRTDEFSGRFEAHLANESELLHLFDRRKVILERRDDLLERARRRFGLYVSQKHTGGLIGLGPRLEVCVVPRFPARSLCRQGQLKQFIMSNCLRWRGSLFPKPNKPIIHQHESAIVLGAAGDSSMFESNVWGMFFYCQKIADSYNPAQILGIHLYGFVGHLLLCIRHASQMLKAFGYAGSIRIEMALASILKIQWLHGEDGIYTHSGSELDDSVSFSIDTTTDALHQNADDVAADLLRLVFFSVNWPELIETPQKVAHLISAGCRYNSW